MASSKVVSLPVLEVSNPFTLTSSVWVASLIFSVFMWLPYCLLGGIVNNGCY